MSTVRRNYEQNAREASVGGDKPKVLEGLTPRVIIMLVILTIFSTWLKIGCSQQGLGFLARIDELTLPSPVGMFVLLLFSFISFKLKPLAKKLRLDFTKSELVTMYIAAGLIFMLSSTQFAITLIAAVIGLPFRLMTTPSAFSHTATLSRLLFPWDETAIENFMFGEGAVAWGMWFKALSLWFVFFGAIFFLLYAIGALLYSRWNDIERLPFPLVTPVVKLTESMEGTAGKEYSLRNVVFLIGLLIPVVWKGINILHGFFPVIPQIGESIGLHDYFSNGLIGQSFMVWPGTFINIQPYVIGIGYLVPTDFSFSIWFSFYVLQRLILFPALISAGIPTNGDMYPEIIFRGGVLFYGIFLLWVARRPIAEYIRAALGKEDDPQKFPMSPKLVFWGSIVSIIVIIWFGMALLSIQFHMMLFFLLTLITIAVVHARFRSEPGLPFVQMWVNSSAITLTLLGSESKVMNTASRVGLNLIDRWMVWSVPSTTAWVMEGLKMADETGMKRRSMMKALGITILLLFVISFPLIIKFFHSGGFMLEVGSFTNASIPGWVFGKPGYAYPAPYGWVFWILGAVVTMFCAFMRLNFIWWPLHPWGFLLGQQLDVYYRFPGSFLIAWLIKIVIGRWFGKKGYERLKPLFIGLILSDVVMMVVAALISIIQNVA
jgi:hypothetical protein